MPKYEIEIPDGVLPEGTVPVAYRKPQVDEAYSDSYDSTHLITSSGGLLGDRTARLIVEKRPEPKFKVGDKVLVGVCTKTCATIHSVGSTARGPYYCLQYPSGNIGVLKWYENELKPYTEPQKPKFQPGDQVCFSADAMDYPFIVTVVDEKGQKYTIHSSRTGWTYSHINESSIKPYVEKPQWAVIDDPLPKHKFSKYDLVTLADYPGHAYTVLAILPHATNGTPWYSIRRCHDGYKQSSGEFALIPWTEPELPPAKFKVGDYALLNNEAVIILSDRQRGITLDGKEGSPRYIVRPAKGDGLSVTEESLTLVDPPKFKVGDWVKNTRNGSSAHAITRVKWWDWGKVWWYVLDNNTGSTADYLKPATRVPLTQDDAVKLALGAITPKDIQLEDKRLEASLAHCQAKQLGRNEAGPTLWLKDPKEVWDTAYPISDLTRLV